MTREELDHIYCQWTDQLHKLVESQLGRHVDVEYVPEKWIIRVYSGYAEHDSFATVPSLVRPFGELRETVHLPSPADNPSPELINDTFRALCLAVARILEINVAKLGLPE